MPFGPGGPGGPPGGPGGPPGGGVMGGGVAFHGPGGSPNGLPYPPANIPDAALYNPPDQKGPGYPPAPTGGYQGPAPPGAVPMVRSEASFVLTMIRMRLFKLGFAL